MMKPRTLIPLAAAAALILLATVFFLPRMSAQVNMQAPEGFAEQKTTNEYRAVSPEGVLMRVRTVRNYPKQELSFWREALRTHLLDEGYHLLNDGEAFSAGVNEGVLYEWGLPYGQKDYIYLTAVIPAGRRIIVAEAAGEHTLYRRYRKALRASLLTIKRRFSFS
jgi:hypothetical protein